MKLPAFLGAMCSLTLALAFAQDKPDQPTSKPRGESELLQRLVGEWTYEAEELTGAEQAPRKFKGTEKGRMVGDWAVLEGHGETPGGSFTGILTVGYDPDRKKFVGTWICSMSCKLIVYEGTADASNSVLTLETEAPNPALGGKVCKFRDVIESKGEDQKVIKSMVEMDGKWVTFLTIQYRKKQ